MPSPLTRARLARSAGIASVTALSLVAVIASPVAAAGGGAPKIRSEGEYATVVTDDMTLIDIHYRCATGHTAAIYADIWQGGTSQRPVSLYNTEHADALIPELVCDGDKHYVTLGLIRPVYPYYGVLGDTSLGYARANVTVILYDLTTGYRDTDFDEVDVLVD
jgi:hypothetical protein